LQQRLQANGTTELPRPTATTPDGFLDTSNGETVSVSGNLLPLAEAFDAARVPLPVATTTGQIALSELLQPTQPALTSTLAVSALATDIARDVASGGLPAGLPGEWTLAPAGSLTGPSLPTAENETAAIIVRTADGQTVGLRPQILPADQPVSAAMRVTLAQTDMPLRLVADARSLSIAALRSTSALTPGYALEAGALATELGAPRPATGMPATLTMLAIMQREVPFGASTPERVLPPSPAAVEMAGSSQIHSLSANSLPPSPMPLGASAVPALTVATSVGQPGWTVELGQRVTWMARAELREAQLQLHPRSLGPVEVRIVYGHEQQLNVSFSAPNAIAREALDAALPRLREMFEQQGLNLMEADISHESFAEQRRQKTGVPELLGKSLSDSSGETTPASVGIAVVGEGMIDAYV
jgi:flagellar hook-length control protein FliK